MRRVLLAFVVGSLLAAGITYGLYLLINHWGSGRTTSNIFTAMHMSGWQVFSTNVVVVIVGMAIGSLGSAIAIRRFLDV